MSVIKERIIGALTVMSEDKAEKIWNFIEHEFSQEVEPTKEEIDIIKAYNSGDEKYRPFMSHEDLKKELGMTDK